VLVLRGFQGYFDEGGHPADPNVQAFALGGCVASAEDWIAFDQAWTRTLRDEGVRDEKGVQWFHMKDFAHFRGAFAGWTEARRRTLLARLVDAMITHRLGFIGIAWQFDPADGRHDLEYYYNAAYRTCLLYAAPFACGTEIDFIFSSHEEISPAVYEDRHRRVREAYAHGQYFGSLIFGDPRRLTPLQAADLIAYELRGHASNLTSLRWPLQQLPRDRCRFELLSAH
jgi:hypothetical protein